LLLGTGGGEMRGWIGYYEGNEGSGYACVALT
jgi:hypothetical protein